MYKRQELDWCERIRNAGYTILFEPKATIYHKESVSVGQMSTLKTYYITRNRILFMAKNRSKLEYFIFTLFLFFVMIPKNVLMYMLKRQWAHLSVFWKAIKWNYTSNSERKAAMQAPVKRSDALIPPLVKAVA